MSHSPRPGQTPADFILRGYLGTEPIGLELIDGYFLEVMHLETLVCKQVLIALGESNVTSGPRVNCSDSRGLVCLSVLSFRRGAKESVTILLIVKQGV